MVPVETPLIARVFAALADGRFHSGEALARTLGVSRSAIWKSVAALKALGSELHAVRNRGYRLAHGSEPLDSGRILERLTPEARALVARIDSVWSIDSTNTALLGRANPPHGTCEVLLTEYQTAGRGRRGRTWLAPPGGAICLSLSWSFQEVPQDLAALGLAMGVCALRALRVHGFDGVTLKWPNDLLVAERKLGGVLIDLRAESAGPASVVIGIGLNVSLGAALLGQIAAGGTAATDLASTHRPLPARNALAAALLSACVGGLAAFAREGLKPFVEDWRAADALRGRAVSVSAADGVARGIARGIDLRGALMLETPAGLRRFISGDVSVRL
ncbi:MAG: biotin--[acetyl-CoA-carboxylase] ligase [Gammaproteobacteria bacterium]|nr:biotin--[acetyl-CoA-carboxylase] ligase [Gammaproteobacteria bacterium]